MLFSKIATFLPYLLILNGVIPVDRTDNTKCALLNHDLFLLMRKHVILKDMTVRERGFADLTSVRLFSDVYTHVRF